MCECNPQQVSEPARSIQMRDWLLLACAGAVPFVLSSGYFLLSHNVTAIRSGDHPLLAFYLPLLLMTVLGASFLARLPMPRRSKTVVLCVYLPCMYYSLFVFAFLFVGLCFGEWF